MRGGPTSIQLSTGLSNPFASSLSPIRIHEQLPHTHKGYWKSEKVIIIRTPGTKSYPGISLQPFQPITPQSQKIKLNFNFWQFWLALDYWNSFQELKQNFFQSPVKYLRILITDGPIGEFGRIDCDHGLSATSLFMETTNEITLSTVYKG